MSGSDLFVVVCYALMTAAWLIATWRCAVWRALAKEWEERAELRAMQRDDYRRRLYPRLYDPTN